MKATIYAIYNVRYPHLSDDVDHMCYVSCLDIPASYESYQPVTVEIPECLHPEVDEYGHICWAREFYESLNRTNLADHYDYPRFMYRLKHMVCGADGFPLLSVYKDELDLTDASSAAYIPRKDNDAYGWIPLTIIERGPITPYTPPASEESTGEFFFDFD